MSYKTHAPAVPTDTNNLSKLPLPLQGLPYVTYALVSQQDSDHKPTKVPCTVTTNSWTRQPQPSPIRWSDQANHLTAQQAAASYQDNPNLLAGVGVILQPHHNIACIDLDGYQTKNAHIFTLLEPFTHRTYTEISQSGNGIHMFFRHSIPFNRITKPHIELYPGQSNSFIAMTAVPLHSQHNQPDQPYPLMSFAEGDMLVTLAQSIAQAYDPHQTVTTDPNQKYKPPKHVYEGERDTELFRYICHRRAMHQLEHEKDYSYVQLLHIASQFNLKHMIPPLTYKEVNAKVKSALRYSSTTHTGEKYV